MMNPSRSVSPAGTDSSISSPRSESFSSLASSSTSLSREELLGSPRASSPASCVDFEPEDVLVLSHPPEGTHVVETSAGPILRPVTRIERILTILRGLSQYVSDSASLWTTSFNEALGTLRRFVTDRILRLDPVREELRPLRNKLAAHGYPIESLQNALRDAVAGLGPLGNRVDFTWVQKTIENRLVASLALEPALASPDVATLEKGLHDFRRALRHIMTLATSPDLCAASRKWPGWSVARGSLSSWADGFASLSLLSSQHQQFLFMHAPPTYSLCDSVLFVQALAGGPQGDLERNNAMRLSAFLAPTGEPCRQRLSALLKLSPKERWRFLGEGKGTARSIDASLDVAVGQEANAREARLFEKAVRGICKLTALSEIEVGVQLDSFLAPAHDRRAAWLQRLVRLPAQERADLILTRSQRAQSLLALETLATEHEYAQRLGGTFEVFAE